MRLFILSIALALAAPSPRRMDLPVIGSLGVQLAAAELDILRRGNILVKMLTPQGPSEIAVFVGSRVAVTPERFNEALQQSAVLWRGAKVPRSGAFSSPVQGNDVAGMQLPAEDVEALRQCRPGDCDVKLSGAETQRLRAVIDGAQSEWHPAVQVAFRSVVLDRIRAYRRNGLAGLLPFHDHEDAVAPAMAFNQLASGARISVDATAPLLDYFRTYPRAPLEGRAEHIYWLEVIDTPKPVIQAAHTVVERMRDGGAIEAAAVTRQIFATHYINASVSATMLGAGARWRAVHAVHQSQLRRWSERISIGTQALLCPSPRSSRRRGCVRALEAAPGALARCVRSCQREPVRSIRAWACGGSLRLPLPHGLGG